MENKKWAVFRQPNNSILAEFVDEVNGFEGSSPLYTK
jgi:hypothetical protein